MLCLGVNVIKSTREKNERRKGSSESRRVSEETQMGDARGPSRNAEQREKKHQKNFPKESIHQWLWLEKRTGHLEKPEMGRGGP